MFKRLTFKIIKIMLVILILISSIFIGMGCSIHNAVVDKVTIENKIEDIRNNINYVQAQDIDETFLNAIVAIEDHRFYKHGALDVISLARAIAVNIKNRDIVEGGSTITQQLVKNLFLDMDQTIERKIKEIFISFELEKLYSKDEILELYVNVIYYGDGYTGVKEACNGYFNKEPHELTDNEATLLAGLPQAPCLYALNNNYDKALERQEQVIDALNKLNMAN